MRTPKTTKKTTKKNPNQNPSQSSENSNSGENSNSNTVEVEIDNHEEASNDNASFMDRAKSFLKNGSADPEPDRKPRKKYITKADQQQRAEAATLIATILILITASWNAPETIKPSSDEMGAVSDHLAGIILRHIDISQAMTADVLDIIGIMAVLAAYVSRVAPEIRRLRGDDDNNNKGRKPTPPPTPPDNDSAAPITSSPAISQDTKDFLAEVEKKAINHE